MSGAGAGAGAGAAAGAGVRAAAGMAGEGAGEGAQVVRGTVAVLHPGATWALVPVQEPRGMVLVPGLQGPGLGLR